MLVDQKMKPAVFSSIVVSAAAILSAMMVPVHAHYILGRRPFQLAQFLRLEPMFINHMVDLWTSLQLD